jgi:cation:H+ antiporter
LAVGNVVGSNIFNLLAIAGISGLVKPLAIPPDVSWVDWSVLLGLTFLVYLFVVRRPHHLVRFQGALLLLVYVGYSTYLFLR